MARKEFAPGIPYKENMSPIPTVEEPQIWEFGVHDHKALKRGPHYDLRLSPHDKKGPAFSWAMLPRFPKPGESIWAIRQPDHSRKYMDWEGTIPRGTYGAGDVSLADRDKVEVIKATPDHVSFNVYRGSGAEEYSIHKIYEKMWRLTNKTLTKEKHPDVPEDKPKYKEVKPDKIPFHDDNYVMSAKIDDAHTLFYFPKTGDPPRALSYRGSKRTPERFIEHTHKVDDLHLLETPKELSGTIVRGGLYAIHPKTGIATPHHVLAGLLNSNVWKSREQQEEHGTLRPIIYDVVRHKGKDLSNAPYAEKLEVLNKVKEHFPDNFELPRMAFNEEEKKKLHKDIIEGKVKETTEGVVLWHLNEENKPAIKSKLIQEHDVYVRDFFPATGKYKDKAVGGFTYSHTSDGPVAGKIGTGFSDALRMDMYQNPEKYKGLVASAGALDKFEKSQSLRAPSFLGWHLDKNPQDSLDKIKHASFVDELLKILNV